MSPPEYFQKPPLLPEYFLNHFVNLGRFLALTASFRVDHIAADDFIQNIRIDLALKTEDMKQKKTQNIQVTLIPTRQVSLACCK